MIRVYWPALTVPRCLRCKAVLRDARKAWQHKGGWVCTDCLMRIFMEESSDA